MTYEYRCSGCKTHFDVIKSYKEIDRNETCPSCGEFGVRQFVPNRVGFTGTKVQHAEYNPALGKVVKNKRHRDELAKRMGLVEVGNDYGSGEKMQKHFDDARKEKLEKRWEED